MFLILVKPDPELEKTFKNVAEKNKKHLYFSQSNKNDYPHLHKKLVDYLGANFVPTPAIFINEPIGHHSYYF